MEGREGTALASQTKEGDGGECGEKADIQVAKESGGVRPRCTGGDRRPDGWWGGMLGWVEDALAPQIGDGRS